MNAKHFTWDGTESALENLLFWWGTLEPFVHSENCDPADRERTLHCCEGESHHIGDAVVSMETRSTKHGEPLPIYFQFIDGKRAGKKYEMQPGDIIFYEDGKFGFLENMECVVVGANWP